MAKSARALITRVGVLVLPAIIGAVLTYFVYRPSPVAFGTCSPIGGSAPLEVTCENESQYLSSFTWNFGDDKSEQNDAKDEEVVTHIYDRIGTYEITLTATGNGKDTWKRTITVEQPNYLSQQLSITVTALTADNIITRARRQTISQTKDDHPVTFGSHSRKYRSTFHASPGFRIVGSSFREDSANHVRDFNCNIGDDGSQIVCSYRLTSGPSIDRWRGWIRGDLEIVEERTEHGNEIEMVNKLNVRTYGSYALRRSVPMDDVESLRITDQDNTLLAVGSPEGDMNARGFVFRLRYDHGQSFLEIRRLKE